MCVLQETTLVQIAQRRPLPCLWTKWLLFRVGHVWGRRRCCSQTRVSPLPLAHVGSTLPGPFTRSARHVTNFSQ